MARQGSSAQRKEIYEENGVRRNPYLVDYEGQRRRRMASGGGFMNQRRQMPSGHAVRWSETESDFESAGRRGGSVSRLELYRSPVQEDYGSEYSDEVDVLCAKEHSGAMARGRRGIYKDAPGTECSGNRVRSYPEASAADCVRSRREEPESSRVRNRREELESRRIRSHQNTAGAGRSMAPANRAVSRPVRPVSYDLAPEARPASRRASTSQRPAAIRRKKKQRLMQKLLVSAWVLCILVFAVVFAVKSNQETEKEDILPAMGELDENPAPQASGLTVQGIPAEKFAEHPEWTEDLLTPNEYSRPGNALESVNNIFVHYTANPGTSAAQNRSYFEWQKDTHEASVSAHFVIGYEGEIIQCVPLDEIAYAVMTRNYDSISIECCYLEKDGSFTQATYDSLISLLAWLVDVYDLESQDILRHYDCGGKKCPLYYTENPGEWEQLKKDVDNFSNL